MPRAKRTTATPATTASTTSSSQPTSASPISEAGPNAVRLTLSVKPNSKSSGIESVGDESISVHLSEPARDGKANSELRDLFSSVLGVKKRDVTLEYGSKSHDKTLLVSNISSAVVLEKLKAASQS
ncbi:DUF167 domain-containing protein [Pelomyxa schiedti]|nr:DUF167 domain-containing protein [Pelomyxa schiedti]